jgi:disulfide oxidoreductase YuzD
VIYTVETLASISKDKNEFLRLIKKRFHPERDFPYIDIDVIEDKDLQKETKFDKAVKVLMKNPPQKKKKKK